MSPGSITTILQNLTPSLGNPGTGRQSIVLILGHKKLNWDWRTNMGKLTVNNPKPVLLLTHEGANYDPFPQYQFCGEPQQPP